MTQYNVRVNTPDYNRVKINAKKPYGVDVNYQVPTKAIQYSNEILDNFQSQFNGTRTTFDLKLNGVPFVPFNDQQLIVSLNNVILEPSNKYGVSGNQITFATPPAAGSQLFIVALITTADLTRTINYAVDNGSWNMNPGIKGNLVIDVTGVIESWTLLADYPGTLELDIKKSNYTNYPVFTSICGSEKPKLNNVIKNTQDNFTTWDRSFVAGDIIQIHVDQVSTIRRFLISLKVRL